MKAFEVLTVAILTTALFGLQTEGKIMVTNYLWAENVSFYCIMIYAMSGKTVFLKELKSIRSNSAAS
jgi:hypothetical protein